MPNLLLLGRSDKTNTIAEQAQPPFLIIDDGPIIDALPPPHWGKHTELDWEQHTFSPLRYMTDKKARDFIAVLDAIFPEGQDTLTKKSANHIILKALLRNKSRTLENLIWLPENPSSGQVDAYQKIENLMLSPVLERVLNHATNIRFNHTLYARLNRAELGDFVCFVLGNFLIAQFPGQVIIPDFGFYACKPHWQLIRQNRLMAGLNFLDEVPAFRNSLLLMDAAPRGCIYPDAEALAIQAGIKPHTDKFDTYVYFATKP